MQTSPAHHLRASQGHIYSSYYLPIVAVTVIDPRTVKLTVPVAALVPKDRQAYRPCSCPCTITDRFRGK